MSRSKNNETGPKESLYNVLVSVMVRYVITTGTV